MADSYREKSPGKIGFLERFDAVDDLTTTADAEALERQLTAVEGSKAAIYDRTGREIMLGDVLKVFHFVGRRNKRHYMYKQVVAERVLKSGRPYWLVSHLELKEGDGYLLAKDGTHYPTCEIVQSVDARFEDRPRHSPAVQHQGAEHG